MFKIKERTITQLTIIMVTIIIVMIFIIGLNTETDDAINWQDTPINYKCTIEQFKIVNSQAEWCIKNTDYSGSYCYGTAMINFCTKRVSNVSHN